MRKTNKIVFSSVLITTGILSRTVWHPGNNLELVTATTLISTSYLGWRWGMIVPLSIMFVTDLILGNTNIFLFTWSGYFMISYFGYLSHLSNLKGAKKVFLSGAMGVVSSIWFYLWTNFGVWLLDSWGMYPKNITGLIDAYILGLPFFKNNLLGNIVLVPLFFFLTDSILNLFGKYSWVIRSGKKARYV